MLPALVFAWALVRLPAGPSEGFLLATAVTALPLTSSRLGVVPGREFGVVPHVADQRDDLWVSRTQGPAVLPDGIAH
eukprot:scaffold669366_cov36-Prasinocladus_malaysianus.AAC.1